MMTGYILEEKHGISDYKMLVLGDDNVIFVKGAEAYLHMLKEDFADFGHESNLVWRGKDYDQVEFCSMRPWRVAGGPRVLGPKVFRLLSKVIAKNPHYTDEEMDAYLRGIVVANKHYYYLPVLGAVMRSLRKELGRGKTLMSRDLEHKIMSNVRHSANDETWEMFTKVYGLDRFEVSAMLKESNLVPGGSLKGELAAHGASIDGLALNWESSESSPK